jgi:excisionase family DNA binding protein
MAASLVPADASAKLLDVQAVAEVLGCSTRHVYRLADSGKMPRPVKLGALVRWRATGPGSLGEWVNAGCPSVRAPKRGAR